MKRLCSSTVSCSRCNACLSGVIGFWGRVFWCRICLKTFVSLTVCGNGNGKPRSVKRFCFLPVLLRCAPNAATSWVYEYVLFLFLVVLCGRKGLSTFYDLWSILCDGCIRCGRAKECKVWSCAHFGKEANFDDGWWQVQNMVRTKNVNGDLRCTYLNIILCCFMFLLSVKSVRTCFDMCLVMYDGCNKCDRAL